MEEPRIADQSQQSSQGMTPTEPVQTPSAPPPEELIPKSKVNEMIRHSNANVAVKARRDALEEYQSSNAQSSPPPTQAAQSIGGMAPVQDIQNLISSTVQQQFSQIQQKAAEQQQLELGNKLAADFTSRLESVKDAYSDFENVTKDFPFGAYPHTIMSSLNFENTGDIMYELANHPEKMEAIEAMAKRDAENSQRGMSSNLAYRQMQKLAESIKLNKQATTQRTANPPLSHLQPSPVGTDNGENTVKDLRNASWLRNLGKRR